jgi:hypothetical protein
LTKKILGAGLRVLAVLRVFLRGVLGNRAFFDGNLLVKLWWLCGELWCEDGAYLSAENFSLFSTLFLARPIR